MNVEIEKLVNDIEKVRYLRDALILSRLGGKDIHWSFECLCSLGGKEDFSSCIEALSSILNHTDEYLKDKLIDGKMNVTASFISEKDKQEISKCIGNHMKSTVLSVLKEQSRPDGFVESLVAENSGISLYEFNRLVGYVSQQTGRGNEVVRNALKTIFTRLSRSDIRLEVFRNGGFSLGRLEDSSKDSKAVLLELNKNYKSLSEERQRNISISIAGNYLGNFLLPVIQGLEKFSQENK